MKKNIAVFLGACLIASLALAGCGSASTPTLPAATATPTTIIGGSGQAPAGTTGPTASAPDTPAPSSSGNCDNSMFPVVAGATWSYVISGGPSGPVTYTSSIASIDAQGFQLMQAFTSLTVSQRWACSEAGLVALDFGGPSASLATQGSQASFTTLSQAGVTLPKTVSPGDNWTQNFEVEGSQTLPGGSTGKSEGSASYQSTAIGLEEVTVDAGTFQAMRIDSHLNLDLSVEVSGVTAPFALSADISSWYAPGVGLVKMIQSGTMLGIALNTENDLTAYSLP